MRLHNTLTRTVEELVLATPGHFGMYVCGPTVQDVPHIGHARPAIVPDVLRRFLESQGVVVFHVRNITDVEDKIIAKGHAEARPPAAVAEHYTRVYEHQMDRLGVLPPHVAPRATGHLLEMIELITTLIERGNAYESGGDVWFSVRSFPAYGQLSGRDVDDEMAGARVDPDERKRDPLDFSLWKSAKPGEPSWPSPWGRGRPGWHIECSAMARLYLGEGFDLHAGGQDLIFPHHTNEIAQSEAATGTRFARHWLHNALLSMGGEKMSKSIGNIVPLSQALDAYGADTLRMFYLSAHYRSPVEYSPERLAEAAAGLDRWRAFLRASAGLTPHAGVAGSSAAQEGRQRFQEALADDLNTPRAHAALFDLVSAGNAALEAGRTGEAAALRDIVRELAGVLGYQLAASDDSAGLVGPLVAELLHLRAEARARGDFAAADAIRARLGELGITVEDSADGARWHLAGA